jgi:fatty-acyl-CoA synthase
VASVLDSVGSWIPRRAAWRGDQLAVADAWRRLDYRTLEDRTARLAALLRDAGLGPGDRVALLLGNRSAYLEAVFAAARLGAIAVPLNLRLAPPEIVQALDDCTPRWLLHEATSHEAVERVLALAKSPPPERLAVGGAPDAYEAALAAARPWHEVHPADPDDPMLLMYTSGTTGTPKGALLPHRKTLYNSLNAQLYFPLTPDDRVLVAVPLFHSFGLVILSIPTLYAGGSVHLASRFDPEAVWQAVGRDGITGFGAVPTMFRALLETLDAAPAGRFELGSLRFLFSAGANLPLELLRAYAERGLVLKQGFGQTETSILCCLDARDALRKAGSVGRPVFHAELRVARPATLERPPAEWEDALPGETGEIVVRGPITMLGYWRRPEETARTLRDGWLRTGDLATRDAEGFVTLVGRAREMFISGGENVYPAQVEAVYQEHPDVREIAVRGVPDARWGEVGCAWIVAEPGRRPDPAALAAWGRERLAGFKVPRFFVEVEALPRTASGKVQAHRLPPPRPGSTRDPGDHPAGSA